ncbi:hypothetical protein GCM10028861_12540 [Flavobacterium koreense]
MLVVIYVIAFLFIGACLRKLVVNGDFIFNLIYFTNIQKVYNLALTGMASFFSRFFLKREKKIEWMAGKWITNKAQAIRYFYKINLKIVVLKLSN